MSDELENIILTIDTHEEANKREKTRIATIKSYVESHGCDNVFFKELKHGDYEVIGHFRDTPVNIAIEYKTWDNLLSDSIEDMEEKLLSATAEYDHVGFFVETQNYTFTPDENNKHGKLNYSIPKLNKNLPAKTLAAFEGFLDTISKHPQIHVRQLRSEMQFPYSLYDLLVYLQNEHGLTRNGYLSKSIFLAWYKSLLATIPSLKSESTRNGTMTKKRIEKVIEHYPNLFWLCSASEESLMQVMGKQIGMTIYTVLHYDGFVTDEWKAGHHQDGTVKYKTICGQDCYNPQHCNALCERHPNNPKFEKGSKPQDDEGRPAFDAPAKNPVDTNTSERVHTEKDELDQVQKYGDGAQTLVKSCTCTCAFATSDPKNRAECKTPNNFKRHSSHPGKVVFESTHLSSSLLGDTSKSLSNSQAVCSPFSEGGTKPKCPGKYEVAVTHDASRSSSTEQARGMENYEQPHSNTKLDTHDTLASVQMDNVRTDANTSSHPGTTLVHLPSQKPGDLPQPPITADECAVKQEGLGVISSPAETHDIGLDDKPLETAVRCRACHQIIPPEQDDGTGFCQDPDCKKIRGESSLENKLRIFLREPHTVEEIVEKYGCSTGYTYQVCMANVNSGNIKKVTEQNGRITFQRII